MLSKRAQRGLSLVELMVAMAISSFLILGVTQIYIDNKRNYLFQQGQSENQENGRYALMMLDQYLKKTGYRRRPDIAMEDAFPASPPESGCTFTAGQTITRLSESAICIRYQPRDAAELDCQGNGLQNATKTAIALPYTTSPETIVQQIALNANGQLTCVRNGVPATLLDGVAAVRFDFGVGPATGREVTSFTNEPGAGEVIRTVRYSLLMKSSQGGVSQGISSKAYSEWYGDEAEEPADGTLYQIASSTSALRNLMP